MICYLQEGSFGYSDPLSALQGLEALVEGQRDKQHMLAIMGGKIAGDEKDEEEVGDGGNNQEVNNDESGHERENGVKVVISTLQNFVGSDTHLTMQSC